MPAYVQGPGRQGSLALCLQPGHSSMLGLLNDSCGLVFDGRAQG